MSSPTQASLAEAVIATGYRLRACAAQGKEAVAEATQILRDFYNNLGTALVQIRTAITASRSVGDAMMLFSCRVALADLLWMRSNGTHHQAWSDMCRDPANVFEWWKV